MSDYSHHWQQKSILLNISKPGYGILIHQKMPFENGQGADDAKFLQGGSQPLAHWPWGESSFLPNPLWSLDVLKNKCLPRGSFPQSSNSPTQKQKGSHLAKSVETLADMKRHHSDWGDTGVWACGTCKNTNCKWIKLHTMHVVHIINLIVFQS